MNFLVGYTYTPVATPLHTRHNMNNHSLEANLTDEIKLKILEEINRRVFQRLIPSVVILGVFCLVGTIGNSISVYVFASRMKRNFQNNLFIYLCANNTMACAVCIPGDMVDMIFAIDYPSSALCKVTRFFNMFTLASYVLTLGTISVYRLRAASVAGLAAPAKRTSVRGIVAIVLASVAIAWIGAVVYGFRSTPTGMQGIVGEDCALADDISDTGWPVGFYSLLGIGFTALVLTVGISYYKIWRIVKRSKTIVAGHTTVNAMCPVATGLAVVTGPREERQDRDTSAAAAAIRSGKVDAAEGGPKIFDLLPSISVVYQMVNADAPDNSEETSNARANTVSGNRGSQSSPGSASGPKVDARHITRTDLCGMTSLCVFDERATTREKMYERSGSHSYKGGYSPVKRKALNPRRDWLQGLQIQSRSNPDLATIVTDDKTASLTRALSFSELGRRANQDLPTKTNTKPNINLDKLDDLPKDNGACEFERSYCDSSQLIKRERSSRNSDKHTEEASISKVDIGETNSSHFQMNFSTSQEVPVSNNFEVESLFSREITPRPDHFDLHQNSQYGISGTEVTPGNGMGLPFEVNASSPNPKTLTPINTSARAKTTRTALENAITRTAFLLTFTFIVSYLPFFVVSIPHFLIRDFDYNQDTATLNVINMAYRLYFVNPTVSPFIFWASNLDFRRSMKAFCARD